MNLTSVVRGHVNMAVYQSSAIAQLDAFRTDLLTLCQKYKLGLVPDVNGDDPIPADACLMIVPFEDNRQVCMDYLEFAAIGDFEAVKAMLETGDRDDS